jgi:hypothetical protein
MITEEQAITLTLARCAVATGSIAARYQVIRLMNYHLILGNLEFAEALRKIAAEGPSRSTGNKLTRSALCT